MKKRNGFFAFAALTLAAGLASCGGGSATTDDPNTINVVLLNAGWGDEWFNDVVTEWEAQNEGCKVNVTSKYEVKAIINKRLASSSNTDDLYIATDSSWKNYAAQGKFLALDSWMEEEVDGVKLEDKVAPEYRKDLYFPLADGSSHVYRLPWTNGIGGIYYNAKMFETNGWKVPETTTELLALVQDMMENPVAVEGSDTDMVKPFVFSGSNTDYFDYCVLTWWMQLTGYDSASSFFNYDSLENFNYANPTSPYASLKKVVEYWRELHASVDGELPYINGSLSFSKDQAQQAFFNGKAAMMFNGDWLYNETLDYGTGKNFEVKLMKTPTFEGAKQTDTAYVIGSDQFIAVPATTKKEELVKSFVKLMVSDRFLSNFTNKSHGFLAYENGNESLIDKSNSYVASCLEARNGYTKKLTDYSQSRKYLDGDIKNVWVASGSRPFLGLLQNSSKTVESSFQTLYQAAAEAFK